MLKGFKYILDENSSILILGTFPGEESRKTNQYYGNKRNQFWRLLFEIFNQTYNNDITYEQKIDFLLKHNIALWDVIYKCLTDGSLDSKIKEPVLNDIQKLINNYPNIKKVFCNGQMVYNFLKKQNIIREIEVLPSSSPTNTMKYEQKLILWKDKLTN